MLEFLYDELKGIDIRVNEPLKKLYLHESGRSSGLSRFST